MQMPSSQAAVEQGAGNATRNFAVGQLPGYPRGSIVTGLGKAARAQA